MKKYKLTICKLDNPNETYITEAYGDTLAEAIDDYNYWTDENGVIGIHYGIIGCKEEEINWNARNDRMREAMEKAISNKIESIHKILQSRYDDDDKTDMIKCIVNESPYTLSRLDTACREYFTDIILDN